MSLAATLWLIPAIRGEAPDAMTRYVWLGDGFGEIVQTLVAQPVRALSHLVEPNRILYLVQLLVPTGFVAVLGLPELGMALPGLAMNLQCQSAKPIPIGHPPLQPAARPMPTCQREPYSASDTAANRFKVGSMI